MGYTAIGEQVGMAQRMESVAPPVQPETAGHTSSAGVRSVEAAIRADPNHSSERGAE